jgi:hypothetical protein
MGRRDSGVNEYENGGGASLLTAAALAGLVLVALALLSSFVPTSLPARRRLSDDRQARPG